MHLGTWITTRLFGELVGTDRFGNRYYRLRRTRRSLGRERRWVVYNGEPEASRVPPEWHAWLHHTRDVPVPEDARRPWQKEHVPNLTGTPAAYRPPGHPQRGAKRPPATGDYEPWRPPS